MEDKYKGNLFSCNDFLQKNADLFQFPLFIPYLAGNISIQ